MKSGAEPLHIIEAVYWNWKGRGVKKQEHTGGAKSRAK